MERIENHAGIESVQMPYVKGSRRRVKSHEDIFIGG